MKGLSFRFSSLNTYNKIRQFSFVVEYVYLAFMCVLIIRTFHPRGTDFGLYMPLFVNISIALVYSIVLYVYSGKGKEPKLIELVMRFLYLLVAGQLMAEINSPSVQIIIVLPTVIMALRYPLKYTLLMALMTSIVIIFSQKVFNNLVYDYLFIFVSFIWVLGLLVNASMEMERQMQEERQKLQEKENLAAIGQMAAGIAHEVRNPLTTIKGFVQLLDKYNGVKDTAILKSYLEMIDKEIDRVNSLVRDFLQYAKPNKPQLVLCDLNNTLADLLIMLEAKCLTQGITMEASFDPHLPQVLCDENQIKQVILNVALNSIDSMENSPEKYLKISTYYDPSSVYIRISDTGCGMTAEQKSKMFVPFYTTKEGGTGLGLSVCYSIIENHSGALEVDTVVNAGTVFRIIIPISDDN